MKTAVVSGTFDPVTTGHADLIDRAAKIFGKVIVAVSKNTEKKNMFSDKARLDSVKAVFASRKDVKVVQLKGLLAELVKKHNGVLVRGVRGTGDYDYETDLALINAEIDGVETLFLPARPEYSFISSTFVRDMIIYRRNIEKYVPAAALEVLKDEIDNH
ncbi:MAG: pantetheine-phosphate adenylyltransferase [Clostridia bacterium]|nr:pantetheine-phosphate adenylyltransferase [Clostridia bacterium]